MKADGDHMRLVRLWVAECCTADAGGPVEGHVLYPHFREWAQNRFGFDPGRAQFWLALDALGYGAGDGLRTTVPYSATGPSAWSPTNTALGGSQQF